MPANIPSPIQRYFDASRSRDAGAVLAAFTERAVVIDDNKTHKGFGQIGTWINDAVIGSNATTELRGYEVRGMDHVVNANVSGPFAGSPVNLDFVFELQGDLISKLEIR